MQVQFADDTRYSQSSAFCCPLQLLIWKIVSDCLSWFRVLTLPWVCSILSFNCLTVSINHGQNSQRQINSMYFFSLSVSHPSPLSPSHAIFTFIALLRSGIRDQGWQDIVNLFDYVCTPQPHPNILRQKTGHLYQKQAKAWFLSNIAKPQRRP